LGFGAACPAKLNYLHQNHISYDATKSDAILTLFSDKTGYWRPNVTDMSRDRRKRMKVSDTQ